MYVDSVKENAVRTLAYSRVPHGAKVIGYRDTAKGTNTIREAEKAIADYDRMASWESYGLRVHALFASLSLIGFFATLAVLMRDTRSHHVVPTSYMLPLVFLAIFASLVVSMRAKGKEYFAYRAVGDKLHILNDNLHYLAWINGGEFLEFASEYASLLSNMILSLVAAQTGLGPDVLGLDARGKPHAKVEPREQLQFSFFIENLSHCLEYMGMSERDLITNTKAAARHCDMLLLKKRSAAMSSTSPA